MKKSLVFATSLLLISSLLFSGCRRDTPITPEQEEWIEQIEDWYPDDEFTYNGHTVGFLGSRNESAIMIKSGNFPDFSFEVYKKNGELYSTYPGAYHKKAVEDYYKETLDGFFRCDKLKVEYIDPRTKALPCEYISDDEFLEKYAVKEFSVYLTYKQGRSIPEQDEIVPSILKYVDSIGCDCTIHFYLNRASKDKDRETQITYYVACKEDLVQTLTVKEGNDPTERPEVIVDHVDIQTALEQHT